jgi:hypothetical protein
MIKRQYEIYCDMNPERQIGRTRRTSGSIVLYAVSAEAI